MDKLSFLLTEGWSWFVSLYYGVDRLWLGVAVAAAVLLGTLAGRYVEGSHVVWKVLVIMLVGAGALILILALMQMNVDLLDPEDLARSQVSI